jgi:hypothetical protein
VFKDTVVTLLLIFLTGDATTAACIDHLLFHEESLFFGTVYFLILEGHILLLTPDWFNEVKILVYICTSWHPTKDNL